jgi:hypothetical protein
VEIIKGNVSSAFDSQAYPLHNEYCESKDVLNVNIGIFHWYETQLSNSAKKS